MPECWPFGIIPPELDALLERARYYRCEVYAATGVEPTRFPVTDQEYHLLQRVSGSSQESTHMIFGMEVSRPRRILCDPAWRIALHPRFIGQSGIPTRIPERVEPVSPLVMTECVTRVPRPSPRELLCPCGEVLWDLSDDGAPPRVTEAGERLPDWASATLIAPRRIDSEASTLAEWAAGVDALLREVDNA